MAKPVRVSPGTPGAPPRTGTALEAAAHDRHTAAFARSDAERDPSPHLAGPADNTICYYDKRVDANASHAYQLAKAVCLFSPWQFLYWYDRPASAQDEPELEFYDRVPTVWDDTKVLHGRIGEYAAVARRRGDEWFIGVMNSGEARTLDLPLGFLEKGKRYAAHVYSDDPSVATRTKVKIERFTVTAETTLKAAVTEKGGQAIRIAPAGAGEVLPAYR
jgi:alpha-glucosidase